MYRKRPMADRESLKEQAGRYAVRFIENGMTIGLGTGSTVKYFLIALGEKIETGELKNIRGVSSSIKTDGLAGAAGIPLVSFSEARDLDVAVDGADEVDPDLNLIKGGGGALMREKILAQACNRYIIIIDDSKYSPRLGTHWPVPVEVIPFAVSLEQRYLEDQGARVQIRSGLDGRPVLTDQQNCILDCNFGVIEDPYALANLLDARAGIMAHGLFLDFTTDLIMAGADKTEHLRK